MSGWRVYLLRCADGTLYAGVTTDLARRLARHNDGTGARYTAGRRPVALAWSEEAPSRSAALRRELAIKKLSRRAKEALIATALLLALLAPPPCRAAPLSETPTPDSLATACWTPEALRGSPEGRARRADPAPFPPGRERPAAQAPALPPELRGAIRRVSTPGRVLALTFDLCEGAGERSGYDERVVNLLRERGVKATFFAGGKWMRSHPEETLQLMADPRFELGTHGWAHRNVPTLDRGAAEREILRAQAQYELLRDVLAARPCAAGRDLSGIPKTPALFRFPYGACDAASLELAADLGLASIQWDDAPGDPAPGWTPEALADAITRGAHPGSIVVLHANGRGEATADALALALPRLAAKGFSFLTVSELLRAGTPETSPERGRKGPP